jgi:membrane-associated phospholipid phosphatase
MAPRTAFRYWLLALVLCAMAVEVCIAYVDRALAEFVEAHLRHTELWIWLDRMLRPLDLMVVFALFFLFGCGIWAVSGRQPRPWTETPLLCAWSATWAVAADIILKRIFGRAWPDPTYVQNHLYGLHLLPGETTLGSFPSGTAAIAASIASVLWIVTPRSRVLGLLIVVLLSGAVVVGNYHWLSDVIAGAFLGTSIGWSTVRLLKPVSSMGSR